MSASPRAAGRRLGVLDTHPIQYFDPIYRGLTAAGVDLKVYFCSRWGATTFRDPGFGKNIDWGRSLTEGYEHEFLPNLRSHDAVGGFASLINPTIVKRLREDDIDVLWIHGYRFATHALAIVASRMSGRPIMYRSEASQLYEELSGVSASHILMPALKRHLKATLLHQFQAYLVIGTENRRFYIEHGCSPRKCFQVPYVVDNAWFQAAIQNDDRSFRREDCGASGSTVVFIWVGKLIPKKAPLEVMSAFLDADLDDALLIVAGDGPLRDQVDGLAAAAGGRIRVAGFQTQVELRSLYAISDVHVRSDGRYRGDWGVTLNEAMASGLAIISSDGIAAARDLVRNGRNGYIFPWGNYQCLVEAIRDIAADSQRLGAMKRASCEIISEWGVDQAIQGVTDAMNVLCAEP